MQPLDWIVLGFAFSMVVTVFTLMLFIGGKALDQDPYEIAQTGDPHLPAEFSPFSARSDGGARASGPAVTINDVFPPNHDRRPTRG